MIRVRSKKETIITLQKPRSMGKKQGISLKGRKKQAERLAHGQS
tara:strand:+ start:283 stop:414 length:132 start_codon:yes stop_codon:yes gene_type:complete